MVHLKTEEEVQIIKESAQILGKAHAEVAKRIKPGVKTKDLDKVAEEFIRDHHGLPSFKNYGGSFPATLCISVNEIVVHGFPGSYEVKESDIISIDCGVQFKGFHLGAVVERFINELTQFPLISLIDQLFVHYFVKQGRNSRPGSVDPDFIPCIFKFSNF